MKLHLPVHALLAGVLALAAPAAAGAAAGLTEAPPPAACRLDAERTIVTFPTTVPANGGDRPAVLHALVPLAAGTRSCSVKLLEGQAGRLFLAGGVYRLRGRPVVSLVVEDPGPGPLRIAVLGDGGAAPGEPAARLDLPGFAAACGQAFPATAAKTGAGPRGSYVVISAPEYASAAATLAAWKRRKGFPTAVALTSEIGTANSAIKAWLQDAYDTWPDPPAYVVLLGDIDDIPGWSIAQNLTDQPYACLDGDDWLPDLCLGRLSVENAYQAETVVAKTVGYERSPDLADPGWFTRSLMVAANYPAVTPVGTIMWCGRQLEKLHFDPAAAVLYDPYEFPPNPDHRVWDGGELITGYLEAGVSIVAYRGWAYGVFGWQPPEFTTTDIPGVENGAKLPVVLSFVCDTANFSHEEACMGEVFLRQGTPTTPKGAVAFIGNTEFWSHTRFNDALALAFFERVIDPGITDLGGWILAGKLRLMDYFPLEMEVANETEESVEFYFNIYNLLGDPELGFWKQTPTALTVSHPAALAAGANLLELSVREADGSTPLAGARVGVVQGETLLGCDFSDADGVARVALSPVAASTPVQLTVTCPGRICYEATLAAGDGGAAHLAAASCAVDDAPPAGSGNGDGLINPGETIALTVSVTNGGAATATAAGGQLSLLGPATLGSTGAAFGDVLGGQTVAADAPFLLQVDPGAEDGVGLTGLLEVTHSGGTADRSRLDLAVSAPALTVPAISLSGDGLLHPGTESALVLTLHNAGSAGTSGGTAVLELAPPGTATLTDAAGTFDALPAGGSVATTADGFGLSIAAGVAEGTVLNLSLQVMTNEGYQLATSFSLSVGQVDAGIPTGPDAHGYYAYDSADIEYPDQAPTYRWTELSPTFGGSGTEVPLVADGVLQVVDLPFDFVFYGVTYRQIRVSDNGWISFDTSPGNEFYNWPIPSSHGNNALVAPFWDNFDPNPADLTRPPPDGVYYAYDDVAGTFTVEWSRASHYQPEIDDLQTFQVVLRNPAVYPTLSGDGEILFLYKQVRNSDYLRTYATIGIESPAGSDGLQLSYSNLQAPGAVAPGPGLAVKLTTARPLYVPYVLSTLTARREPGGVRLSWAPADARPVVGWRIYRGEGTARVLLTAAPLPADTRSFLDPAGGDADVYRLEALHPFGHSTRHGPAIAGEGPLDLTLAPCWPNPVHDATRIEFALPRSGTVTLQIYDLAGRCVRRLFTGSAPWGTRQLIWDGRDDGGRDVADGVYFYRLEAGGEVRTRKLLLVR